MIGNLEAIEKALQRLTDFEPAINRRADQVLKSDEVDTYLSELIVDQQNAGIRGDGTEIEPYYKPYTVAVKLSRGQPVNVVTLRDTGAYQRGMKAKANGSNIEFYSTDSKSDDLKAKYGNEIESPTDETVEKAKDFIKPELIDFTHEYFSR